MVGRAAGGRATAAQVRGHTCRRAGGRGLQLPPHVLLTDQRSLLDGGGSHSFCVRSAQPDLLPGAGPADPARHGRGRDDSRRVPGRWRAPPLWRAATALARACGRRGRRIPVARRVHAHAGRMAYPVRDLGLYFFSALALHERSPGAWRRRCLRSRRRCSARRSGRHRHHDGAVARGADRRERIRWLIATGAVLVAWALAFVVDTIPRGAHAAASARERSGLLATPMTPRWGGRSGTVCERR